MDKNKMLIDATHPEETRVVVLRNGRVEEFDYESASRKLLRGNIYLAKVTRVEPSLQAAFVEYGGNRHGFLAFSEIHPDYYQIPIADRELLKQEEAEAEAAAEAEADERARQRDRRRRRGGGEGRVSEGRERTGGNFEAGPDASFVEGGHDDGQPRHERHGEAHDDAPRRAEALDHDHHRGDHTAADEQGRPATGHDRAPDDHSAEAAGHDDRGPAARDAHEHGAGHHDTFDHGADHTREHGSDLGADLGPDHGNVEDVGEADRGDSENDSGDADQVEQVAAGEDALEELPERPRRRARQYKIQEVIKRRQIILVQVVKEERGNKGAALTTYISLAGRYTVLMPNTGRGGGISRKITQPQDRKRLKAIAEDLDVSEGMGLIVRTAGAAQSKQEIKRDYEYLLRLWESVRDLTLTSTAPCLVYEEGNLIKRSIRDLYSKEFDDIQVAGAAAYTEAHDFMGMLMPGHADSVVRYEQPEPLFTRFGIERQLNAMFNPVVTLRSGGYIVINQTEALVAIDVNSGKSTREFSIEETAINTNNEAAEEIARQLKLRDLAGLIVVDFIDMEEKRNNRTVERRMKDALRHDRARIQVGRISHFGLLEMSRQRLRTGVVEGSTSQCPHCLGTGNIRSTESIALAVLRGIEDNLMKQPASLAVTTNAGVALYILNNKRQFINEIEQRLGIAITVEASERMHGANFSIERTATAPVDHARAASRTAVSMDWGFDAAEAGPADDVDAAPEREPPHVHRNGRDRDREGRESRESRGDRVGRDRGNQDLGEPREDGEEPRGQDEVRAEGEDGGRNRRRRRRRGRREGGDDRGHTPRTGAPHDAEPVARGLDEHGHDEHKHGHGHDEQRGIEEAGEAPVVASSGEFAADRDVDRLHGENNGDRAADGEDNGHDGIPREGNAGDGDENRPKRGRRRGRRGGRARGREDTPNRGERQADTGPSTHADSAGDNAGWGLIDVAKPGAEQPGAEQHGAEQHGAEQHGAEQPGGLPVSEPVATAADPAPHDHRRGIVTAAGPDEPAPRFEPRHAPRISIVETVPVPAHEMAGEPARAPDREHLAAEPARMVEAAAEPTRHEAPAYVSPPVASQPVVSQPVVSRQALPDAPPPQIDQDTGRPARKGWWQRRFGGE